MQLHPKLVEGILGRPDELVQMRLSAVEFDHFHPLLEPDQAAAHRADNFSQGAGLVVCESVHVKRILQGEEKPKDSSY
jgi:hypothetical protein